YRKEESHLLILIIILLFKGTAFDYFPVQGDRLDNVIQIVAKHVNVWQAENIFADSLQNIGTSCFDDGEVVDCFGHTITDDCNLSIRLNGNILKVVRKLDRTIFTKNGIAVLGR